MARYAGLACARVASHDTHLRGGLVVAREAQWPQPQEPPQQPPPPPTANFGCDFVPANANVDICFNTFAAPQEGQVTT